MQNCRLVIVRHAETVWNVQQRLQGHKNSDLTDVGRRQAQALARRFASHRLDALYCSDLSRAIESLRPLAEAVGVEPVLDTRLRERNLGVLEGLTADESMQKEPETWQGFKSNDPDFRIPGGESQRNIHERVRDILHEVAERHSGQQVVLMGHGGTLNHVLRVCLSLPLEAPRAFSSHNASVNIVDVVQGQFRLQTWGDVSHLE